MTKREMMKKGLCFKFKKHGHGATDCPTDEEDTNDDDMNQEQGQQHFMSWKE